ncbi:MAG TPA: hypothetical protein VD913_00665 [bacterium]|nr:hypothetical protein [bacterium]
MIYFILLASLVSGCKSTPVDPLLADSFTHNYPLMIQEARESMAMGEFYRAQQITKKILENQPNDRAAENLMAEIIDGEIARQRESFDTRVREELTDDEKSMSAKTWLERSQALLSVRQYDEALLAAERVFLYDPDNLRASQLIDQIRDKAYKEGKGESLILKQIYEGEIQERLARYREQAGVWIEEGKWGAAKLAVEKILILAPEDREGLALYDKVKEHQRAQPK